MQRPLCLLCHKLLRGWFRFTPVLEGPVDRNADGEGSESRFASYVEHMASTLGHADRRTPFRSYCTGLILPGERNVIRRGKVTPGSGVSASKIDPPIFDLFVCLLWHEAGGGGCWLWRRSVGYGASILFKASRSRKSLATCGCPATRFVRCGALTRRRFLMSVRCSRARSWEDGKSNSIGCWRRTSKRRRE